MNNNDTLIAAINSLKEVGVLFSVIKGKFSITGIEAELKSNPNFIDDLDIVLHEPIDSFLEKVSRDNNFLKINQLQYVFVENRNEIVIDIYSYWISTNEFRYLKPRSNEQLYLNEQDYMIYLLFDPLIKFGEYKIRHRVQIEAYKNEGSFNNKSFRNRLRQLIFPFDKLFLNWIMGKSIYMQRRVQKLIKARLLINQILYPSVLINKIKYYATRN